MLKRVLQVREQFLEAAKKWLVPNETGEHFEYAYVLEDPTNKEALNELVYLSQDNMVKNLDGKYWRFNDELVAALMG